MVPRRLGPARRARPGETPYRALERELAEELGIKATVTGERFARVQGHDFRTDVWVVDRWTGEPTNQDLHEHDALAWRTAQEMGALRLADARLPQLVQAALELPWQRTHLDTLVRAGATSEQGQLADKPTTTPDSTEEAPA